MVFLLGGMLALLVALAILILSSSGSLHLRLNDLEAKFALVDETTKLQARANRKWMTNVVDKYATLAGFVPPAPSMLDEAYAAILRGEEPKLDFTKIGARR